MDIDTVKKFFKIYSWTILGVFILVALWFTYEMGESTNWFTKSLPFDTPGPGFFLMGYIAVGIVTLIIYLVIRTVVNNISDKESNEYYKKVSIKFFIASVIVTVFAYISSGPQIARGPYAPDWNPMSLYFIYLVYLIPVLLIGTLIRYVYSDNIKKKIYLLITISIILLFVIIYPIISNNNTAYIEKEFQEIKAKATETHNPELCDEINIAYRGECKRVATSALDTYLKDLASETNDITPCHNISTTDGKYYCITQIAINRKDADTCLSIAGRYKYWCLQDLAKDMRNNEICEHIDYDFEKNRCTAGVCYQIIHDYGKWRLTELSADIREKYPFCNESNT